ncbi:MAG TPA: DNA-binding protein [Bacillus bacterium]|nr:DNA-binding protein [Bacillus sp. (in: firmicutes)]
MPYYFEDREQLKKFIESNVLNSSETTEFLGISRARLSHMIRDGKLVPLKKLAKDSLFLLEDLEEKKKELEILREKYRPYDN